MMLRLAWRELKQHWKRSTLGATLFAVPVLALLLVMSVNSNMGPSNWSALSIVPSRICDAESEIDEDCVKDSTILEKPDIQRLRDVAGTEADSFYPIWTMQAVARGSFQAESYFQVGALDNSDPSGAPKPGTVELTSEAAELLGVNSGDTVQFTILPGSDDAQTRDLKAEITRNARFFAQVNSKDFDNLADRDHILGASRPQAAGLQWISYSPVAHEAHYSEEGITISNTNDGSVRAEQGKALGFLRWTDDAAFVVAQISRALLGILLLASVTTPVFAVSARRALRANGLLSVNGATPSQLRRLMLWQGILVGGTGAVWASILAPIAGNLIGLYPDLEYHFHLDLAIAVTVVALVCGLFSAMLPAWWAGRSDPVEALAGGSSVRMRRIRWWHLIPPIVGILALAALLFKSVAFPELLVVAIIACTIFSSPLLVLSVSKLGARLPLSGRLAARDCARNFHRTVPAIAAVSGCLLIAIASLGFLGADENKGSNIRLNDSISFETIGANSTSPAPFEMKLAEVQQSHGAFLRADLYALSAFSAVPTERIEILGLEDRTTNWDLQPEFAGLTSSSSYSHLSNVLIASPGVIDIIAHQNPGLLSIDQIRNLSRTLEVGGAIVTEESQLIDGQTVLKQTDDQSTVLRTLPAALLPLPDSEKAGPVAIITPETARLWELEVNYDKSILAGGSGLDSADLMGTAFSSGNYMLAKAGTRTPLILKYLPMFAAWVLTFAVTLLVVLLATSESRRDVKMMQSMGATRGLIRKYGAAQGAIIAVAGVLGAGSAALAILVVSGLRLRFIDHQDVFALLYALPWKDVTVLGIGVIAIGWLTGLIFGTRSSAKDDAPLTS